MRTAVVLFTRDLRVHDHPALAAACRADRVVPLFVLDDRLLRRRYATPNRVAALLEALTDLRASLRARGGDLVVRRGDPAEEVAQVVRTVGAGELHLSADVSSCARRRTAELEAVAAPLGVRVATHPGVVLVEPGDLAPASGDHFRVFTPYWRRWLEHPHRQPVPAPARIVVPADLEVGSIPARGELVDGDEAPERLPGGEAVARQRLAWWFAEGIDGYDEGRDDLAADRTSQLSPHLPRRDLRSQGDRWRDDDEAVTAWQDGRTGYPIVDAGMRQLRREGWMHNRARLITASFLTKHLRVDWRIGAWHFMDHLVDGDLADNFAQWQWVAGTGTDSRPNRMFNPTAQGQRYDPSGAYVRRYVPELAHVEGGAVHRPWRQDDGRLFGAAADYPAPLVDHAEARERFLADRGR